MRNRITYNETELTNNQLIGSIGPGAYQGVGFPERNSNLEILVAEGCENFVNYIEWLGFSKEPNLVVLSSMHHYFFDSEEMKNVRTLVNLKELNQVKQVNNFIHSLFNVLPSKSYFIGCFIDNNKYNGFTIKSDSKDDLSGKNNDDIDNGISSRFPFLRMIYNLLDSRTSKFLSRREVTLLLSDRGFRVLDMTELNGLTYFCAQKLLTVVR
jgi:hypothetical protein